jgi:hypothetical protein
MNRRLTFIQGILSIAVASGLWTQACAAPNRPTVKRLPPPPDYFPLSKDYWWKYQTTATTGDSAFQTKVVSVEKRPDGTYVYDLHTQPDAATTSTAGAPGFDEWYVKPKGWVVVEKFAFNGQPNNYDPPRKYLANPLKVDIAWEWEGTKSLNTKSKENSKVDAVEDVEVPAGKFKAMKVTTDIVQGGMPVTKTYWYAPWIGLVQSKTDSGGVISTTQLTDYSFKKPEKDKLVQ